MSGPPLGVGIPHRQAGEVAFKDLAGQCLRSPAQLRERLRQPGHGENAVVHCAHGDTGRQPPPGPALSQVAQPARLDPVEAQPGIPARVAEAAELPDVTAEFAVPAQPFGQVVQPRQGVGEEPAGDALMLAPGPAQHLQPLPGRALAQRLRPGRQELQQTAQITGRGLGACLISAALQAVGDLSAHHLGIPAQVEPVAAERLAFVQEFRQRLAATFDPAAHVRVAQTHPPFAVKPAVWHRARRARC